MNPNLTKLALPTLIGLALAGTVVGLWAHEIINLSFRTDGTIFSEYATQYPAIQNPAPSDSSICDPAYKSRWAGCALSSK